MTDITDSSLAAGVGVSANNTTFTTTALNVPRKLLVCATVLPANEGSFTENVPEIVTSVAYHANKAGRGTAAAKMLEWVDEVFKGEVWLCPQFENAFTQATGDTLLAGTATEAGTLHIYIGGHKIPNVVVAIGDDAEAVVDKIVAAVTANPDLPVTCVKNATPEQADFTAKSGGPFGDFSILYNLGFNEKLPAGITVTSSTQMTGGAGVPTLQDALDELGIGDDQNEKHFTALLHINGQDSTSLDALSTWNGIGNTVTGNWGQLVHRPLRSMIADNATGSAALTALLALGAGRKETDRTSGCVGVPGSANCIDEISAKTVADMEKTSAVRAQEGYVGHVLPGIWPGNVADRWTVEYSDRDTATKAGITATTIEGGSAVLLSNVVSFYHSASIPVTSNGYREMCNIAKLQNILTNTDTRFKAEDWKNFTIVEDISEVESAIDREKVKTVENVRVTLNSLADVFYKKAWLYNSSFTKEKLKEAGYITIRPSSDGFNMKLPVLLSGVGNIIVLQIDFDINLAAA
jgi:phage tail sheath gpL-like